MSLGFSDGEPQRVVHARGQRVAVVVTGRKIHPRDLRFDGVVIAVRAHLIAGGFGNLSEMLSDRLHRRFLVGCVAEQLCRIGEHFVSDLQFERLIRVGIGICEDMQAEGIVGDVAAVRLKRDDGEYHGEYKCGASRFYPILHKQKPVLSSRSMDRFLII